MNRLMTQRSAAPWPIIDLMRVAAMIANQLVLPRIKPQVSPALIAGKTVFVGRAGRIECFHALEIAMKYLRRHNAQRIVT